MPLNQDIIVVSGLPRSGTSLMMAMLVQGGIPAVTDEIRHADPDNPRGYFEFEQVKQLKTDHTWLPNARGKCVKIVSPLLYHLPPTETFRVIFMQRDLDEVIASQEKMLQRRGQPVPPAEKMRAAFEVHLDRLQTWLTAQRHIQLLPVSYNHLMTNPTPLLPHIAAFLDDQADITKMQTAIDTSLYRNRGGAG
ncbi:sulfotransferase domain-containing protein [Planctomicrobium piriforme]|uniref:Sulfotransferase domain-containing protein n=1 Tax=Planctomicrobium piriforme TaxID=1576369 RepID=A0A1I3JXR4_9PLAN|nr:sulfotransferase domain-containing protein [Planctomicrobium piriforme]SFI64848.1 Sulfotransferase domain-containing protein [Planctomicrobium piriforme]